MPDRHEPVSRIEIKDVVGQRDRPKELHPPFGIRFFVHHPSDSVHHLLRTVEATLPVAENVVHLPVRPHAVSVFRIIRVPLQPVRDVPDDPPIPHETRQVDVVHRLERRLRSATREKRETQNRQQPNHFFHVRSKPVRHPRVKPATSVSSLVTCHSPHPLHFLLFPRTRPSHAVR